MFTQIRTFSSKITIVAVLISFATNCLAMSSGCFFGKPDGVSYNTAYHEAAWTFFDVGDPLDIAYMVTEVDGPTPGARNDNFLAGGGGEVLHYLTDPEDGSYDIVGGVWLDDGVPYLWADCWDTGEINNTTYSAGICNRTLAAPSVPTEVSGISVPTSIQNQVDDLLDEVWTNHWNARYEKKHKGQVTESGQRGFFANDGGAAVAALIIYLMDDIIPDSVAYSDSYVPGHVATDNTTCTYNPVAITASQYATTKSDITYANETNYSLYFFQCQVWAAQYTP